MQEADVVLATLRQADGSLKRRPAVILRTMPPFSDLLICGISTQLQQIVAGFDDLITSRDADFTMSGLRRDSVIRLGFLAALPVSDIVGVIGRISPERHQRLLTRLSDYLRPLTAGTEA